MAETVGILQFALANVFLVAHGRSALELLLAVSAWEQVLLEPPDLFTVSLNDSLTVLCFLLFFQAISFVFYNDLIK